MMQSSLGPTGPWASWVLAIVYPGVSIAVVTASPFFLPLSAEGAKTDTPQLCRLQPRLYPT